MSENISSFLIGHKISTVDLNSSDAVFLTPNDISCYVSEVASSLDSKITNLSNDVSAGFLDTLVIKNSDLSNGAFSSTDDFVAGKTVCYDLANDRLLFFDKNRSLVLLSELDNAVTREEFGDLSDSIWRVEGGLRDEFDSKLSAQFQTIDNNISDLTISIYSEFYTNFTPNGLTYHLWDNINLIGGQVLDLLSSIGSLSVVSDFDTIGTLRSRVNSIINKAKQVYPNLENLD